jgi:ERCC4-type nuclease
MMPRAIELDLPLGDVPPAFDDSVAGAERHHHLTAIPGIDEALAGRLAREFPTLGAVYAAGEEQLAAVIGPVAAARLRWFLEAPLSVTALPGRRARGPRWRQHAA